MAPASLDLWDDDVGAVPTECARSRWRWSSSGGPAAATPGCVRWTFADYGDMAAEAAVATSTGITATARRTICSLSVEAIAGEGADSQTGVGFCAGSRSRATSTSTRRSTDAVERATRMLGATKARSGRCAVVLDSPGHLHLAGRGLVGAVGRGGHQGPLVLRRPGRRGGGRAVAGDPVDDPTDARAFGASTHDAEGLACRRNVLIDDGVLRGFVFDTTAARRAGVSSTASAVRGGYATTPVAGCRALLLSPRDRSAPHEILAEVGEGLFVQSMTGVHSGVNPVSGDFSVGAEGLMIRDGVLAEPVREVTIASTLQRMLQSVAPRGCGRRVAARSCRRPDPGHRRHGAERRRRRRPEEPSPGRRLSV